MADNVAITQGAGTNIATDDVGSVHFQKVKLDVGADGTSLQPAGSIPVYVVSGTGAYLMNDAFVDSIAIGGQLDNTATTFATENNVAPIRITPQRALHVYIASGVVQQENFPADAATLSNVASSATNVTLLAANLNRRQAMFYNDVDRSCYLKFGATASATSFTVEIPPNGYYELPKPVYLGIVDGIWDAGPTGSMRVTELT